MSVDLESRFVTEPSVSGIVRTGAPDWFAPHDESPLGYWRKPLDGYVILNQYGENGLSHKVKRGFVMLHQYGELASAGTRTWDPKEDPFYPLVAKGGLKELPAAQIKELGWHRVPDRSARASHRHVAALVERVMTERSLSREEALLVVMPQLRDIDLTDWTCPAHPGRFFPSEATKMAHDSVMHKEAIQSESIGRAVAAANGGGSGSGNDALLALIAQQGDVIASMKAQLEDLQKPATKGGKGA